MNNLAQLIKEASARLNLFSQNDREKIANKHIPDALEIESFWSPKTGNRVLDLGSGGGIPALPLADSHPELEFTLTDATEKKVLALQEIATNAELRNVHTLCGRFEDLAHETAHREVYDIVTARAVAPLPSLLEYAAGFLKVGGHFYAWKGSQSEEELAAAENAMEALGLEFKEQHEYELDEGEKRKILCFEKLKALDEKYPRRNGVPKKNPL